MATFRSDLHRRGVRVRQQMNGAVETVSFTLRIPSGTTLASSDVLKLGILGANCFVTGFRLYCDGDLDPSGTSLTGTLGWLQRLTPASVAENEGVDKDGAAIAASPATSSAGWAAAATASTVGPSSVDTLGEFLALGTTRFFEIRAPDFATTAAQDPDGLGGPVDVAITLTGNGTATSADVYLSGTIEYTNKRILPSTVTPYGYQDRYINPANTISVT